jgi:DNA-binding IclR family transcriptional regulator
MDDLESEMKRTGNDGRSSHPPTSDTGATGAGDSQDSGSGGGGLQSVERAIAVMELLGQRGDSSVSELASELAVHKSTVSRLLSTLQTHGLVEVADRGRYRLGYGLVRLAGMIGGQLDIITQGSEICAALAHQVGETVTMVVRQGDLGVTIHQVNGGSTVTLENWLGRGTPLHATSSGKVLLANLPPDELDEVVAAGLPDYTEHTLTEASSLRAQLDEIRRSGVSLGIEEYEIGLNAIAAPIRIHDGTAPYALSMSGPAFRLTEADLHRLLDPVLIAADEISRRMGYSGF